MSDAQRQVLVVEDEPLVLESTVDLLVEAGFGVVRRARATRRWRR
jgi:CheY-like chemotaxis protein